MGWGGGGYKKGPCAPGRSQVVAGADPHNPATPIWSSAHQVGFGWRASWAQPLPISNSHFPTPDTGRRCLTLAVIFRTWRSEVRMSREQDRVRFQQTDLGTVRSGIVDKFGLTNMLREADYGPLGFDRRSPPSSLNLRGPSLGLDSGVPHLHLEQNGLARGAPPRPSSMLSDGGSATSSPRFPTPSPPPPSSSFLPSGTENPAALKTE